MALVVETGAGVAGANSYRTLADIRAYALARGVTLSPVDATLEPLALMAMDYLEGLRARYQGSKTAATNALQWPRVNVKIDCVDFPSDAIPVELANAQSRLCMEQHAGVVLSATRTGAFIVEDTVGPLTTKYSDKHGGGPGTVPTMPAVEDLLAPLFAACGQGSFVRTLRV